MSSEKVYRMLESDVIPCIVELPTGVNRHTISVEVTGGRSSDMENCRVTDVSWVPIRGLLETAATTGTATRRERRGRGDALNSNNLLATYRELGDQLRQSQSRGHW